MKLKTKVHGILEYCEQDIITFNKGIPGFEEYKKFIITPHKENPVFNVLHSIDNKELGFLLISPFQLMKEYEFRINDFLAEELELDNPEQVGVYNIVTLNSDIKKITVNLKAPIVVNIDRNLAHQVILSDERYLVKHPLIKED